MLMEGQKIDKFIIELRKNGPTQIEDSYKEMESINRKFWEKIQEIYKSTESIENQRNINNEESHAKRLRHLIDFDESLPNDLKEIEAKMKELMEIEQADLLQEEFNKFKKNCDAIMQKKKDLIIEFTKELDFKDQTYVDNMKQFHKDIEDMISHMSDQFITLRKMMLDHLGKIEDKFMEDRKDLIKDQYLSYIKRLIDHLEKVATSKERELTNLQDELEAKAEDAAKKLENEFINKVIIMETHLNHIKEKVEEFFYDIKILFEKLEYRVKIRDEKIKEAEEKKEQFNTWNKKLTDKITHLADKDKRTDLEKRIKNSQLQNELMKMTESFDQLKEKFQHFEKHDELRFMEIYGMKSKESKELALKVALADRTIKTQQLGMENIPNDNNNGFSLDELQKDQELEENDAVHVNDEEEAKNFRYNILAKIPTQRVKQVFIYIIAEAEFLIETATIEACQGMTFEEKLPRYLESMCKALNIKNEVELNQLLALFDKKNINENANEENKEQNSENVSVNEGGVGISGGNGNSGSDNDKEKEGSNEFKIDPDDVLDILKEFYNEKKKKAKEQMLGNASSGTFNGEDNEEAKKERMKYLSETYWEKLGNIISEKTFNVWKALDNSLSSYHQLLFERKELVEEVKDLNEKQSELQKLLKQYAESDMNKKLKHPPHKSIKWDGLDMPLDFIMKLAHN